MVVAPGGRVVAGGSFLIGEVGLDHVRRERLGLARPQHRQARDLEGQHGRQAGRDRRVRPLPAHRRDERLRLGLPLRDDAPRTTRASGPPARPTAPSPGSPTATATPTTPPCSRASSTWPPTSTTAPTSAASPSRRRRASSGAPPRSPPPPRATCSPNSLLPATFSSFPGYRRPRSINWFPDFKNPTCTTVGCSPLREPADQHHREQRQLRRRGRPVPHGQRGRPAGPRRGSRSRRRRRRRTRPGPTTAPARRCAPWRATPCA